MRVLLMRWRVVDYTTERRECEMTNSQWLHGIYEKRLYISTIYPTKARTHPQYILSPPPSTTPPSSPPPPTPKTRPSPSTAHSHASTHPSHPPHP